MAAGAGDLAVGGVDRKRRLALDRRNDTAVRVEDLGHGIGIGEGRPAASVVVVGILSARRKMVGLGVREAGGATDQERVGLGAELPARAQVRGVDATDNDQCEGDGDDERQPEAQAHAVRSV